MPGRHAGIFVTEDPAHDRAARPARPFGLGSPPGADTGEAAGTIVRQAVHAVEGDSVGPVQARWSARLARDSSDRAGVLGLATLARLTYDYPTADRLYPRLYDESSRHPDAYAAYARLGRAWSLEERGRSDAAAEEFARARGAARAARVPAAEAEALIGRSFALGAAEGMAAVLALLDTAGTLIPASALDLQAERGWRRAVVLGLLADPRATAEAASAVEPARRAGDLRAGRRRRCGASPRSWTGAAGRTRRSPRSARPNSGFGRPASIAGSHHADESGERPAQAG